MLSVTSVACCMVCDLRPAGADPHTCTHMHSLKLWSHQVSPRQQGQAHLLKFYSSQNTTVHNRFTRYRTPRRGEVGCTVVGCLVHQRCFYSLNQNLKWKLPKPQMYRPSCQLRVSFLPHSATGASSRSHPPQTFACSTSSLLQPFQKILPAG